jgi:hypothetical protein
VSNLSLAQLQALAGQAGFPDANLAAAVAMAESGGNPGAIGDNGNSIGLWQINLPSHPQYAQANLLDPNYNAAAAFTISSGGSNWKPWTTYNTGAYQRYYSGPSAPSSSPWKLVGLLTLFLGGGIAIWYLADSLANRPRSRRLFAGERCSRTTG